MKSFEINPDPASAEKNHKRKNPPLLIINLKGGIFSVPPRVDLMDLSFRDSVRACILLVQFTPISGEFKFVVTSYFPDMTEIDNVEQSFNEAV